MASNQKPDAAAFMEKWIAHNIIAHPMPQDLAATIAALTHNCLNEAAIAGLSAGEIEMQTGSLAADHIQKAIDKEIGGVARRASKRSPDAKVGKSGTVQPPATVAIRQPPPPPYRLPARHS